MGKGDTPRPVDKEKYDANYKRVFGEKPLNVWKDAPGCEPETGQGDRQPDVVPEESGGQVDQDNSEALEGEETV
jgi:hypothetical protein